MRPCGGSRSGSVAATTKIVGWYFREVYGTFEGPGTVPFYCDPSKVGHFAVDRTHLASGCGFAVFQLLAGMAMFQARRDVVIMRQQAAMGLGEARSVSSAETISLQLQRSDCPRVQSAETFDSGCSVAKHGAVVDCTEQPGMACHVKSATRLLNRTGDMGKLSTSAWLHVGGGDRLKLVFEDVVRSEAQPSNRAQMLVERLARIHRVGRKIATMVVSALSTPALAPGLTPWYPAVDGNDLVVVDTNVARAVDALHPTGAKTYEAREHWVRGQATEIDLNRFHPEVPSYSPRLVQQALYAFCSKSNRYARRDACLTRKGACRACVEALCPLAATRVATRRPRVSRAAG